MKKKASKHSAFFDRRGLLGFALFLLAALLAYAAVAQGPVQEKDAVSAAAPSDLRGVKPVHTHPLREMPPIHPSEAPGHNHPEPIRPVPLANDPALEASIPRQTTMGASVSAPTATGLSFDGVGVGLAGFTPSSVPPDTNGRVGATQYVQWNNTSFAVFNKTTGALLYGPVAGNTLFQTLGGVCATHNDGDTLVAYDILSGRWILSQFAVDGPAGSASHQCVAVSMTGDATGAYYLYDFLTDATNFVDYPHMGVWPDGYYMSTHVFNAAGTATVAARIYVFERSAMINGQTARMQSANLPKDGSSTQFGFLPADLDSVTPPPAGAQEYVMGPNGQFTNRTDISRVAVTWGTTPTITLTSTTNTAVGISTAPCVSNTSGQENRDCVPQAGAGGGANVPTDDLDNLSSHYMYRLAYRNNNGTESIVATGTTTGATTTPAHGAVKWMEWRGASGNAAPTLFQSGTYDPTPTTSDYRWMPSIAMDKDGNIALGYSKSRNTTKPSIWVTGRLSSDTLGTMGAEAQVQAGGGVQTGGVNRWGDYSAMTIDPVDQCTFYYTNEYLKTDGSFNWSSRIATYRFPTCTNASAWGTVTGTITSAQTGAPISGVTVTLSTGYAGATNASGVYSILVPAGSYTATAADSSRNCSSASPVSANVTVASGGTATQNFTMSGTSKLEANGVTVDDASTGNGNAIVNRNECTNLKVNVKNNGCATETGISATLTTSTPGVTVVSGSATYPDLPIDGSGEGSVPFKIQTSSSFVCGTNIALSLNVTYASGSKTISLSVPSCAGGSNQSIPASSITTSDPSQPDRLGRDGTPSGCGGKSCPGPIDTAGTRNYKKFTFTNAGGAAACFTVTINAALGGADIQSAAYLNTYTPPTALGDTAGNLCLNYLGDSGVSGLGNTVSTASYSFTVPAMSNFVVVVNTANGSTTSSQFSGTVSGFVDNTAGAGACPTPTPAPTSLAAASASGTFGGTANVSATLTSSGNPVSGKSVSFSLNGNSVGSASTNASGLATLSNASLSGINAGSYASGVSAGFAGDSNFASSSGTNSLTVAKANQTISVGTHAPATAAYNTQFTVAATATSGLAVTYSSSGVCTNSGATYTMTSGTGTCSVKYDQAGNTNYNAASQVVESVSASKANQTINFAALGNKTYGDADFNVNATASSTLPVSFGASGQCTVTGNTVHITGAGSCTITASQAGDGNFNAAPNVPQTFSVAKANQAITVNTHAPASAAYNSQFSVAATSSSGLPVVYSSGGSCSNSGATFTMTSGTGAGSVKFDQPGDTNYNAATEVTESVNATKIAQTITFGALGNKTYGDADFNVNATASSSLSVSFTAAGQCSVTGNSVHITGAGSCTITASQAGDTNYNAAPPIDQSFNIAKADQTVTVNTHAPGSAAYNSQFTVAATASSGLAVAYSSGGSCSNTGATFTMTSGTGTGTVKYDQAGDGNYNAATQVTESVTASKADQTITFGSLGDKTYGDADFNISATASSGLSVSFAAAGQCTVTGNSVHITGAGSCTITASQAGDSNYNSAPSVDQSFNIGTASSNTTVSSSANPSNYGDSVTFTATVSSGAGTPSGTVQFKDGATNIGSAVTLASGQAQISNSSLTPGSHTITADYGGDSNFSSSSATLSGGQVVHSAQIAVEQPPGTDLTNGSSTVDFGGVGPNGTNSRTFTIRNDGNADLTGLGITFDGTNASEFTVTSSPTAPVAPGGTTSFTVQFAPTATGARAAGMHIANNDPNTGAFSVNMTGVGYTYSEAWRAQYFGNPDNTGDGADLNDYDHDGLVNLLELATGTDPTQFSPVLGALARNSTTLEFTYTKADGALNEGILFDVEWTDDLSQWSKSGVTESVLSDDGTIQLIKASVPAGSGDRRFIHLKVTRP